MPLKLPNLDDRSFEELRQEALDEIRKKLNTDWNDLSEGDPGIVLLDAFTYLTDQMIYRLNRLPEKTYIAFLRLLGVKQYAPTAAKTVLHFWRTDGESAGDSSGEPIRIQAGTRVTVSSGGDLDEIPVFVTEEEIVLPPGSSKPQAVNASQFDYIQDETVGWGTGRPGLSFQVAHPPIVARTGTRQDMKVGVELGKDERAPGDKILETGGKRFRIWEEVDNFANLTPGRHVYTVDRLDGVIQFAPAARYASQLQDSRRLKDRPTAVAGLAAIPDFGREIRVWYPRGGGPEGNVPAGRLTRLVDKANRPELQKVEVTNPERAKGGMPAESLDNALIRGPLEIFTMDRAITARDFELLALNQARNAIVRARAYGQFEQWSFAQPGTVEVVVVPTPLEEEQSELRLWRPAYQEATLLQILQNSQSADVLADVEQLLNDRSPIGIKATVNWARYKRVSLAVELALQAGVDTTKTIRAIENELRHYLAPLPVVLERPGWPFGQQLRVADVYHQVNQYKDVELVSAVSLRLDAAPNQMVTHVAADFHQKYTWYAAAGPRLFRSLNDGDGWELMSELPPASAAAAPEEGSQEDLLSPEERQEIFTHICPNKHKAGVLAVATTGQNPDGAFYSRLYISNDCLESPLTKPAEFQFKVEDMAWALRANNTFLLLATDKGLYEVKVAGGHVQATHAGLFVPIGVIPDNPNHPLYAVNVIEAQNGSFKVIVAAKSSAGVYLSYDSSLSTVVDEATGFSQPGFQRLGLVGTDIRHLAVQYFAEHTFLWAAAMAQADEGQGCYCWQFDAEEIVPQTSSDWVSSSWTGGSCLALAFLGRQVFAATAWGGMLTLTADPDNPESVLRWQPIEREQLPRLHTPLENEQRDRQFFMALKTVASNAGSISFGERPLLMTGGDQGLYRSQDRGQKFENIAPLEFNRPQDIITLPQNWLFVAGDIEITTRNQAEMSFSGRPVMNQPGGTDA